MKQPKISKAGQPRLGRDRSHPLPSEGGSWLRKPDGGLERLPENWRRQAREEARKAVVKEG